MNMKGIKYTSYVNRDMYDLYNIQDKYIGWTSGLYQAKKRAKQLLEDNKTAGVYIRKRIGFMITKK